MADVFVFLQHLPRPLIPADNNVMMAAVLVGLAFLGFWVDTTWLGRKTSGNVWLIVAGTALSNTGVIALDAPIYGFVHAYLVPLAIPLLLFKANLRRVAREAGPVLAAFLIGVVGVLLGAVVGDLVLRQGEYGHRMAGVFAASWTGGAVGFVGSAEALKLSSGEYTVAIGATNLVSILGLLVLISIPAVGRIRRWIPSRIMDEAAAGAGAAATTPVSPRVNLVHISGALAISLVICAVAHLIADNVRLPDGRTLGDFHILIVTALSVAVANLFPRALSRLEGDFELGMLFLYIFFAAIGAGTDGLTFLSTGPLMLVQALIVLAVFLVVMLLGARLFRIDLARSVIGGLATFNGVAPTAAVASGRGWDVLVIPGIMCALLGKVSGTFIGVALAALLH
jgi:uncharacterized membrane protein